MSNPRNSSAPIAQIRHDVSGEREWMLGGAVIIKVMLDGTAVPVEREVFDALFSQSVVDDRAPVRAARLESTIPFRTFVELARTAQIPYPLFFAPLDVVEEQLRIKTEKLMVGFTKDFFSMNSRNRVHLPDVELIVKDLLRKQQHVKADKTLRRNAIVGALKRPGSSVAEDAAKLMRALDFTTDDLKAAKTKESALELLITKLEARQVLVARSAKNYMPQQMPKRAKFSGMTIRDAKVPFIFLASGDEGENLEPSGRKMFTLTLLAVLIARGTFAPVTYDGHTTDETSPREYELTAEILMPEVELRQADLGSLPAIREAADTYKVTPSAVVMRTRRLGLCDRETAAAYLEALAAEYANRANSPKRSPLAINALRKYNGTECSRRMLGLLDAGHINRADFCRVMFSNKLKPAQINDYRAAVA